MGVKSQPPPVETRWKKGCPSPNPKGRPPHKRFTDAARTVLAQVDPKTGKSGAETLIELAFRRAKQGNIQQLQILLAYAEGLPARNVKISGGVLHAHTWRPLADLTDEEIQQLAAIRKRLGGPGEDDAIEASPPR